MLNLFQLCNNERYITDKTTRFVYVTFLFQGSWKTCQNTGICVCVCSYSKFWLSKYWDFCVFFLFQILAMKITILIEIDTFEVFGLPLNCIG